MIHRLICSILALAALWLPLDAQEQEDSLESLPLRVVSTRPARTLVVDRGSSDLVERGDRVRLYPKDGSTRPGRVIKVEDRSSVVELQDKSFVPEPGTKGEVLIPASRRAAAQPEPLDDAPDQ